MRPREPYTSHVGYVEEAGGGAHGTGLRQYALEMDGHLPTRERHHLALERDVGVVEGSALQHGVRSAVLVR